MIDSYLASNFFLIVFSWRNISQFWKYDFWAKHNPDSTLYSRTFSYVTFCQSFFFVVSNMKKFLLFFLVIFTFTLNVVVAVTKLFLYSPLKSSLWKYFQQIKDKEESQQFTKGSSKCMLIEGVCIHFSLSKISKFLSFSFPRLSFLFLFELKLLDARKLWEKIKKKSWSFEIHRNSCHDLNYYFFFLFRLQNVFNFASFFLSYFRDL